jgi:hypothetical protein
MVAGGGGYLATKNTKGTKGTKISVEPQRRRGRRDYAEIMNVKRKDAMDVIESSRERVVA